MASELEIDGLLDILSRMKRDGQGSGINDADSSGVMNKLIKTLGIGENAELDNPAERDFLKKIMEAEGMNTTAEEKAGLVTGSPIPQTNYMDSKDYEFDVDGNTQGYTFTGDAPLTPEAIQRMRDIQGITADGQPVTNLGMADPVLMPGRTPTIPEGIPTGQENFAGTGQPNMDAPIIDPQRFNKQFAALGNEEKSKVEEIMANMTEQQKIDFAAGLTDMPLSGYGIQNENFRSY
mgnify:CR=1 FL=1